MDSGDRDPRNYDELLAIIGAISVEWDLLERHLFEVFEGILIDVPSEQCRAMYFCHMNHRARRDMVEALAGVAWEEEPSTLKRAAGLLKRLKSAGKRRNDLAHAFWGLKRVERDGKVEYHAARVPLRATSTASFDEAYSKKNIEQALAQIQSLRRDFCKFAARLQEAKAIHYLRVRGQLPPDHVPPPSSPDRLP